MCRPWNTPGESGLRNPPGRAPQSGPLSQGPVAGAREQLWSGPCSPSRSAPTLTCSGACACFHARLLPSGSLPVGRRASQGHVPGPANSVASPVGGTCLAPLSGTGIWSGAAHTTGSRRPSCFCRDPRLMDLAPFPSHVWVLTSRISKPWGARGDRPSSGQCRITPADAARAEPWPRLGLHRP